MGVLDKIEDIESELPSPSYAATVADLRRGDGSE